MHCNAMHLVQKYNMTGLYYTMYNTTVHHNMTIHNSSLRAAPAAMFPFPAGVVLTLVMLYCWNLGGCSVDTSVLLELGGCSVGACDVAAYSVQCCIRRV